MSHQTHFTTEERIKSSTLHELGYKNCEIAKIIGKSESALSREFKRNASPDGSYSPQEADKMYHERRMNCGHKPILENGDAKKYVTEKLEEQWSPEQIAGRAKPENKPFSLSYNTIYGGMENGLLPKQLKKNFRIKRKYKKRSGEDKQDKIPDTASIYERTAGAENRTRYGHWKSDTVLGKHGTGCFGTHVERKSGFLVAFKIPNRQDKAFTVSTIAAFAKISEKLKKSFTVDNSKEFTEHKELSEGTGMKVYFCDPYSPWQRCSNKNTNGLLR